MRYRDEFERMLSEQVAMALATSAGGAPNVRVVNFFWDPEARRVYFATFRGNDKVAEMDENPQVAFTTIPQVGNGHVKARGTARRSARTVAEMADAFCERVPGYDQTIEQGGSSLVLYEIAFEEAMVTVDLGRRRKIRV